MLVVEIGLTVNVTALTLEQQLSKRRRLVQQMCDHIEQELKSELGTPAWQGLAQLGQSPSLDGHRHAEQKLNRHGLHTAELPQALLKQQLPERRAS